MTGPRREKVSDLIREEVARLIQSEMHDTRLGFVTVTEVRMSPDLKHARIYVSLLAEGAAREQAMDALGAARGFIRRRIGQTLRLKHTPDIHFSLDTSIEYGARIETLIQEARSKTSEGSNEAEEPEEPRQPNEPKEPKEPDE